MVSSQGLITIADVDAAVSNLMSVRFRLGMLDPPDVVPWSNISMDVVGSAGHLELALEAARQCACMSLMSFLHFLHFFAFFACFSKHGNEHRFVVRAAIVLLKNDNQLLPLSPTALSHLSVIGPSANDSLIVLGNYHVRSGASPLNLCTSGRCHCRCLVYLWSVVCRAIPLVALTQS